MIYLRHCCGNIQPPKMLLTYPAAHTQAGELHIGLHPVVSLLAHVGRHPSFPHADSTSFVPHTWDVAMKNQWVNSRFTIYLIIIIKSITYYIGMEVHKHRYYSSRILLHKRIQAQNN